MAKFHDLSIEAVRPLTGDAVAVRFALPSDEADLFSFEPGQYLTLRKTIDGEDVRRSYSICSSVNDPYLEVGIKMVEGGTFSSFAQQLKPGDFLSVMPPQGRFVAELGGKHDYLLLAAGSGITPCLSIARSVLESERQSRVTLVFGNKTVGEIMFLDDLTDMKDRFLDRFNIIHLLSRERQDVALFNGRLDGEKLISLRDTSLIAPIEVDAVYICGPQAMTDDCVATLKRLGVEDTRIKTELFTTANMPAPARAERAVDPKKGVQVEIILDGSNRSLTVDGEVETVLAAAQRQGIELPFSCAGGMCCTCRCKVVEGEARMDQNYSLQKWEVEEGFVLACQSRPESDHLLLDFDAA